MLSIRLDPEIERRLSELAQRTGRTKSYHVRELIEGNLEDLEDHLRTTREATGRAGRGRRASKHNL